MRIYKNRLAAHFQIPDGELENQGLLGSLENGSLDGDKWSGKRLSEVGTGKFPYTIDIEYPVFALESSEAEDEINHVVRSVALREVLDFRSAPLCTLERDFENSDSGPLRCTLYGSFDVAFMSTDLLSFRFLFTSYTGGAYTNNRYKSLAFQLVPKVQGIDVWSLFKEPHDALNILSDCAIERLCDQFERVEPDDCLSKGAGPDFENFKNINIHRHGLSIDFDEHQLGGKALGAPSVFVPYHRVANNLNRYCAVYELASVESFPFTSRELRENE